MVLRRADPATEPSAEIDAKAIQLATKVSWLAVEDITRFLYFFGRVPVSSIPSVDFSSRRLLNLVESRDALELRETFRVREQEASGSWVRYSRRERRESFSSGFKLYAPCSHCNLEDVILRLYIIANELPISAFKHCRDSLGAARPDKVVCYFSSFTDLLHSAEVLNDELGGLLYGRVPFTARFEKMEGLSWGRDFNDPRVEIDDVENSWRAVVCRRIAQGIWRLKTDAEDVINFEEFLSEELDTVGVQVGSWVPIADHKFWPRECA